MGWTGLSLQEKGQVGILPQPSLSPTDMTLSGAPNTSSLPLVVEPQSTSLCTASIPAHLAQKLQTLFPGRQREWSLSQLSRPSLSPVREVPTGASSRCSFFPVVANPSAVCPATARGQPQLTAAATQPGTLPPQHNSLWHCTHVSSHCRPTGNPPAPSSLQGRQRTAPRTVIPAAANALITKGWLRQTEQGTDTTAGMQKGGTIAQQQQLGLHCKGESGSGQ